MQADREWSARFIGAPQGFNPSAAPYFRHAFFLPEQPVRIEGGRMHLEATVPPKTAAVVVLPLHPENKVLEVGPGEYSWEYEAGVHDALLDLDTPMSVIAAEPDRWAAVIAVLRKHFPYIPADHAPAAAESGPDTLRLLVERIRGEDEELENDLLAAIGALSP